MQKGIQNQNKFHFIQRSVELDPFLHIIGQFTGGMGEMLNILGFLGLFWKFLVYSGFFRKFRRLRDPVIYARANNKSMKS